MPALGGAERRTEAQEPPRPPPHSPPGRAPDEGAAHQTTPLPARLTDQQPARPRSAPGAAKQPRPSMRQGGMRGPTPPVMRGGQGRGPRATPPEEGGEEPRRDHPPPLSPPWCHPSTAGVRKARGGTHPAGRLSPADEAYYADTLATAHHRHGRHTRTNTQAPGPSRVAPQRVPGCATQKSMQPRAKKWHPPRVRSQTPLKGAP